MQSLHIILQTIQFIFIHQKNFGFDVPTNFNEMDSSFLVPLEAWSDKVEYNSSAKALVEKEGGKILGTASKKLDYLVVGDSKPTTKKVDKARQLNIKIINESSWYSLLNR